MSRSFEAGREALGEWRTLPCERCAGDNQRVSHLYRGEDEITYWWFGNATDHLCTLCRCEVEAEEQQAWQAEHAKVLEEEAKHEEWLRRIDEDRPDPTGPINYDDIPF